MTEGEYCLKQGKGNHSSEIENELCCQLLKQYKLLVLVSVAQAV
jgi:hypothetical protein